MKNEIGRFTLGAIKSFRGHEGETCLQGTILLEAKKVGEWSDDSWGGGMLFRFQDAALQTEFMAAANALPCAVAFREEMVRQHGPVSAAHCYAEIGVGTLAGEIDLQKRQAAQLKRWCKTKIVLRDPKDSENYLTIAQPYMPKLDAALAAKYPGWEIVNKTI